MSLHGLSEITIGVPDVRKVTSFYNDFGLVGAGGALASIDGGEQLRLVDRPVRHLVQMTVRADDRDDLDRIRYAAKQHNVPLRESEGGIVVHEAAMNLDVRVVIADRLEQSSRPAPAMNAPGICNRANARPDTLFVKQPVRPRRLGHVALGTSDIAASGRFARDVLGFRLSDSVPGVIEFWRCGTDHHNLALLSAPVSFLHHTSWQMESLDNIGHGATNLLATDPDRHVWGLGRHFLGSNLFWYFRDPAGNFAEYYADLDEIVDDAEWMAKTWDPDKAFYSWGPPPPQQMMEPIDLDAIAAAVG